MSVSSISENHWNSDFIALVACTLSEAGVDEPPDCLEVFARVQPGVQMSLTSGRPQFWGLGFGEVDWFLSRAWLRGLDLGLGLQGEGLHV